MRLSKQPHELDHYRGSVGSRTTHETGTSYRLSTPPKSTLLLADSTPGPMLLCERLFSLF